MKSPVQQRGTEFPARLMEFEGAGLFSTDWIFRAMRWIGKAVIHYILTGQR